MQGVRPRLCARSKSRKHGECMHIRNASDYTFSFTFCLSFSLHSAFPNSPFFSSARSCVRVFVAELSVSFIPHAFRDVLLCYGLVYGRRTLTTNSGSVATVNMSASTRAQVTTHRHDNETISRCKDLLGFRSFFSIT